ncbi:MAG: aminotransferase class V-fold PLP-dependent enzyme [Gammaproteobacteria bacterium]|nr:MAG: aminotransferase class V-fold PLP-dependent enzyme [Gammaproteobacteria bacterium]
MTELDLKFIRSQFPAFSEPSLEGFAHFENAGGSYACGQVVEWLHRYYRETKVQPYYGFEPSRQAGEQMNQARTRMAAWLNVAPDEVHFGPSTSQNTYVIAQALRQYLKPGDEIIVTNQDHEANIGVWRRLQADGIVIREWQVNPANAELNVADLDSLLNERTRVVALTHCSNIVGSMHPVRAWTDKIHAAGAIAIVDGVSYTGHGLPDVAALGADIYLLSLYKVYGPHLGVMAMRDELNGQLPNQGHFFNADHKTDRFTPAGPDHAQIAAVNGVIDYFEVVYAHHFTDAALAPAQKASAVAQLFQQAERTNMVPLLGFLAQRPGVQLIGKATTESRAPTVAFTVKKRNPGDIAAQLAAQKIGIGNGNFYAWRLMQALDIPPRQGVVRLSFLHYTGNDELTRLVEALDKIL